MPGLVPPIPPATLVLVPTAAEPTADRLPAGVLIRKTLRSRRAARTLSITPFTPERWLVAISRAKSRTSPSVATPWVKKSKARISPTASCPAARASAATPFPAARAAAIGRLLSALPPLVNGPTNALVNSPGLKPCRAAPTPAVARAKTAPVAKEMVAAATSFDSFLSSIASRARCPGSWVNRRRSAVMTSWTRPMKASTRSRRILISPDRMAMSAATPATTAPTPVPANGDATRVTAPVMAETAAAASAMSRSTPRIPSIPAWRLPANPPVLSYWFWVKALRQCSVRLSEGIIACLMFFQVSLGV